MASDRLTTAFSTSFLGIVRCIEEGVTDHEKLHNDFATLLASADLLIEHFNLDRNSVKFKSIVVKGNLRPL